MRNKDSASTKERALKVALAYRSVSEPAIMAITGVIPIDFLAKERCIKHFSERSLGVNEAKKS